MREAEGLSRLHNTITDWPDSGYTRRIAFIPGAPPPVAVGPRLVRPSDLESEAVGARRELRTRGLGERLGLQ